MTVDPCDRWEPWPVEVRDPTGPERVVYDDPAPDGWAPRPVGFVHVKPEVEPLLWEGDQG